MKATIRAIVGVALIGWISGCAVFPRQDSVLSLNALRSLPPKTVAVLPFHNQSGESAAGGMARDAVYYALADRGFDTLNLGEIDRKLAERENQAALGRPGGSIDTMAAGRIFGAEAIAIGSVQQVSQTNLGLLRLVHIRLRVWLMDARSGQTLWNETVSGWVHLVAPIKRKDRAATPAEAQIVTLQRLARSFDAVAQRAARKLPSVRPDRPQSLLAILSVAAQSVRPVVSTGDRVDVVLEGTPGCAAQATLGSLGKMIVLEETQPQRSGVYRGFYTIEPGDRAGYCRVSATLISGANEERKAADVRSAFVIDTTPPDPPANLAFETRASGVVLKWKPPAGGDVAHYMVFRSDSTTGGVTPMMERPVVNYWEDRHATHAGRYVYFVKALDCAGNPSSSSAEVIVDLPGTGPTSVGGKIEGQVRWTALGGPYRVRLDVDVTPGSVLLIEPGTEIEIQPGMEITVRGRVEAYGRADSPIVISGTEASRGFHLNDVRSELRGAYITISGARRGVEVTSGLCQLEHVTLRSNQVGAMAHQARQMTLNQSRVQQNQYGAILGGSAELRGCEFVENSVGLRVLGDGVTLTRCRFDNLRRDIEKIGEKPYPVDGNIFWTADPTDLCRHLWGNVTASTVLVPRSLGGGERLVQFESARSYLTRAEAATGWNWEKALRYYEAALLQERRRDVIGKALNVYKQIVAVEGRAALPRQTEFCQSAVLAYPSDVSLLQQLAEMYYSQGNGRMAREVCAQLLRVDPKNEFAKKNLAAIVTSP